MKSGERNISRLEGLSLEFLLCLLHMLNLQIKHTDCGRSENTNSYKPANREMLHMLALPLGSRGALLLQQMIMDKVSGKKRDDRRKKLWLRRCLFR